MQKKYKLAAKIRKITGRKVKALRREGMLPANVFGKKIKSQAVELPVKSFMEVYSHAGATGLVELDLDGKALPVLIQGVHQDPVSGNLLHADFHQVDLKEKVTAHVQIEITGEALAVKNNMGTMLHVLNALEIEALPSDLPEKIEIDVTVLADVDSSIKVGSIDTKGKYEILNDKELEIVKIAPLVSKEAEELKKEEDQKAEEAKTEGEVKEGEAKDEGEAVKETQTDKENQEK